VAKLGFTGIGVSNLKKSSDFYQKILELEEKGTYENVEVDLQDGSSFCIDEIVLVKTGSEESLLILMNWPNEKRLYDGLNVKVVFAVDDASLTMDLIRNNGGTVDREASPRTISSIQKLLPS
jgi:catechol 2,3-dioxygenase-like lactoylglutathione lyase family enzyme